MQNCYFAIVLFISCLVSICAQSAGFTCKSNAMSLQQLARFTQMGSDQPPLKSSEVVWVPI